MRAPWWENGGVAIHVGHVLDVLAEMPAGSCQVVVTSPPYYGLRSYGTSPQIWGGDPLCSHSLEETAPGKVLTGGTGTASAKQVSNAGSQYGNAWVEETWYRQGGGQAGSSSEAFSEPGAANAARLKAARWRTTATCTRCGAWRGELGSEPTPQLYVEHIVEVFRAVRRVLHDSGTIWVNLGDSYSGSWGNQGRTLERGTQRPVNGPMLQQVHDGRYPSHGHNTGTPPPGLGPKQLLMMPARVALALQSDGWVLRSAITWAKKSPMPESVRDRPTSATEMVYLLAKQPSYYYDAEAVRVPLSPITERIESHPPPPSLYRANKPAFAAGVYHSDATMTSHHDTVRSNPAGANLRNFWLLGPEPYSAAHFATFPTKLVEPCVLAGTSARGQCPACRAPWRRDKQTENWHNNSDERVSMSPLQDDATAVGVWPGQSEDGRPAALVSGVRSSTPSGDLAGAPWCSTGESAAISGSTPRGNGSPQATLPGNGTGQGEDAGAQRSVPSHGQGAESPTRASAAIGPDGARATGGADSMQPSAGASTERARNVYQAGLATDPSPPAEQMPLLQEAVYGDAASDDRPCNPTDQRGRPQPREHSSGVQAVQLGEVESSNPSTVDGWTPTCSCNAGPPIPQTVLDPFLGSGTTAFVARHHGRRAIGIELNAEYAQLAADRLKQGTLGLELW